jgi:threonine/homoserine/homoserine lactone efflux protein
MPKALTIIGMIVSCLTVILFGADLALGFPFQKASMLMDGVFLACAAMLGYMSWASFREQK